MSRAEQHRGASLVGRTVAVLIVVGLAAAACDTSRAPTAKPSPAEGQVRRGGNLVYASSQRITGFNQHSPSSASLLLSNVMRPVWPSAFESTPEGQLVLNTELLDSAEQTNAAPQTIVYRINPRAVWSDGDPFDGRDFVYLWRTAYSKGAKDVDGSDIAATTASVHGVIQSVELSGDDRTVTVVFARSFPDWKALFGYMVPSHVAERVGWNRGFTSFDPAVVLSAGPFRISGHRPDQDLTLVRNERYWGTAANLDSIIVRLLPESGQLLAAIKNREVDLADLTSPSVDEVAQARDVPGLTTVVYEQARYNRLVFNLRNELLADSEVRWAIALALDRPGILARGSGQLDATKARLTNNRLYAPVEPGYRDNSESRYDRPDPAGAKRLLEGAGFRPGPGGIYTRGDSRLSLRMPARAPLDELIQAQLREAGVEVRIETVADPLDALRRGEFDIGLFSMPTSPGAKAGDTVQFTTGGAFNFGRYSHPTVDELILQANSELDQVRRESLYNRIDEMLWDEMPTVPLDQALSVVIHRDTLANIVPTITGGLFGTAEKWGLRSPP